MGTDISTTELSSHYAAVITPATTDLAIQAQVATALNALPQPAVDLPSILRKRSIVHTEWRHSLHLPTGRSLADWQQALTTAHGAPVCF
ncbi:oxidoreductase [Corynebacterium diphtheriae]|nr:oxidoreductase [Corynebacterium diphtheriae]